jgi:hypothetical protein
LLETRRLVALSPAVAAKMPTAECSMREQGLTYQAIAERLVRPALSWILRIFLRLAASLD